jgi:hypothetical protein
MLREAQKVLNTGIRVTNHCLVRLGERHEGEVTMISTNRQKSILETILKEVRRSICWYDTEKKDFYLIYNQLRVYIGKVEDGKLQIVTEYPYTKPIKRRLSKFQKVKNPCP